MTWYSLLKKNLIICLLSLGILPSLVSCNKEVEINDDVIFTELYNGSNAYDSVLEISVINDSYNSKVVSVGNIKDSLH